MLGPIMGPTLGGWLTDSYSWRWVFFVNLPFGILTTAGLSIFMNETPTRRDVPFSWFGFLSLSLGIGSLQMMLDRGEQLGWVPVERDRDRGHSGGRRLLFLSRRLLHRQASLHLGAHLQGLELLDRAHFHVPDRRHPLGVDGAADALHSGDAGLSGPVERVSPGNPRHRHVRRDVPGRSAQRQGRCADSDLHRADACDCLAVDGRRLEPECLVDHHRAQFGRPGVRAGLRVRAAEHPRLRQPSRRIADRGARRCGH